MLRVECGVFIMCLYDLVNFTRKLNWLLLSIWRYELFTGPLSRKGWQLILLPFVVWYLLLGFHNAISVASLRLVVIFKLFDLDVTLVVEQTFGKCMVLSLNSFTLFLSCYNVQTWRSLQIEVLLRLDYRRMISTCLCSCRNSLRISDNWWWGKWLSSLRNFN